LQAVGQAADGSLADGLDFKEVDDFFDLDAVGDFFAPRRPQYRACMRKLDFILRLRPVMMLSSTVMPLNSAMFWKVRAMPDLAAA
jgi:hypothetical protein